MKKQFTILIFIIGFFLGCKAQNVAPVVSPLYTDEDVQILDDYFRFIKPKSGLPLEELVIETASYFLKTPYVASTLEGEASRGERLVINLRELDCTTFVENVLALAYTVRQEAPTFDLFCHYLANIRYRTGNSIEYTDRLHYFSDWIYENERKGLVKDVTAQAGGKSHMFNLSFMSTHPDSYMALKNHPEFISVIKEKEQEISVRDSYAMIPENRINTCSEGLKNGDIVCFVTKIAGLDVTHVGFIYWQDKTLSLLHASSGAKKVIVDPKPLQQYAEGVKSTIGVMIVRPQMPN